MLGCWGCCGPVLSGNSILARLVGRRQPLQCQHRWACSRPPMAPTTVQFLLAMLTHALNEQMARRVEYLQEEVRALKELLAAETGRTRVMFTPDQRRRLALKGKALTPEDRKACCQIVRPETILAWFRHLSVKKYDSSLRRSTSLLS